MDEKGTPLHNERVRVKLTEQQLNKELVENAKQRGYDSEREIAEIIAWLNKISVEAKQAYLKASKNEAAA